VVTAGLLAAGLAAGSAACLVGLRPRGEDRLVALGLPGTAPRSRTRPAVPARAAVLPVLGGAVVAVLVGPVPAMLALAGAEVGRRVLGARRRKAVHAAERARAVEACSALAAELRAGRPPAAALALAADVASGPTGALLRSAAAAASLGGDVPAAFTTDGLAAAAVPEVLRSLAACWQVCATTGGGLAVAVDRVEERLRADQDRRRAVAAELAGPRATAGMLAVLPAAGLVLAMGLGADPAKVLLHTPFGLACLTLGLLLDGLGLLWTDRLVARAGGG
jgi:tight adherence protein B